MLGCSLVGCSGHAASPAPSASAYLNRALTLIAQNSMDVKPATWRRIADHARTLARRARTPAETYGAIRYAVAALGDAHTRFMTPAEAAAFSGASAPTYDPPSGSLLQRRYAYVRVGAFEGGPRAIAAYVRGGVATFAALNRAGPCGWIVDLRNNGGGNVWPMLTVVAPLLRGDPVGYFVKNDGTRLAWHVRAGRMFIDNAALIPEPNPLRLRRPAPPVAVLTDYNTGSAGEAAVLAFQGQPETRSFGHATMGFATANRSFTLSDGALLLITGALDADRNGHTYRNGDPIYPDQTVADPSPSARSTTGPVVKAALGWLSHQSGCR